MIYRMQTYIVSLLQLIMASIIVSPIATLIFIALSQLFSFHDLIAEDTKPIIPLLQTSAFLIPLTSLPFFVFCICPYVTFLKRSKLKSMKYWVLGISYIAIVFPVVMHALKFIILGALGVTNILSAYFGIYVILYAYYGVHTLSAILISILMYFGCVGRANNLKE